MNTIASVWSMLVDSPQGWHRVLTIEVHRDGNEWPPLSCPKRYCSRSIRQSTMTTDRSSSTSLTSRMPVIPLSYGGHHRDFSPIGFRSGSWLPIKIDDDH